MHHCEQYTIDEQYLSTDTQSPEYLLNWQAVSEVTVLVGEQVCSLQVGDIVEQTLAQIASFNGSVRTNDDEDGSLWVGVFIVGVVPHRKRIPITWSEVVNQGLQPMLADHSVGDG